MTNQPFMDWLFNKENSKEWMFNKENSKEWMFNKENNKENCVVAVGNIQVPVEIIWNAHIPSAFRANYNRFKKLVEYEYKYKSKRPTKEMVEQFVKSDAVLEFIVF